MTAQADSWRKAFGGGSGRRGRPPGRPRGRSGGKRVDWNEVLHSVPRRFGVEDVMKHPGAAAKGRAQIYPALNRWEMSKLIRRVEKGVYEKADGGGTSASQQRAKGKPAKNRAVAKRRPRAAKRAKKKAGEAQAS